MVIRQVSVGKCPRWIPGPYSVRSPSGLLGGAEIAGPTRAGNGVRLKVSVAEKSSREKRQKDSRSPKPVGIRVTPRRAKRLGLRLSFCRFCLAGLVTLITPQAVSQVDGRLEQW